MLNTRRNVAGFHHSFYRLRPSSLQAERYSKPEIDVRKRYRDIRSVVTQDVGIITKTIVRPVRLSYVAEGFTMGIQAICMLPKRGWCLAYGGIVRYL